MTDHVSGYKMKKTGRMRYLPVVSLLCMLGILMSVGAKTSDESRRQKARYYFLQGCVAESSEKLPEAYEFYKKAWQTDSGYLEGAYSYGMIRVNMDVDTLGTPREKMRSLRMGKDLVEKYPADYFTVMNYAYVAGALDTLDESIRVIERLTGVQPSRTNALAYLSQYYAMVGEIDSAVNVLSRYERIEGSNSAITMRKVAYRMSQQDTVEALSEVDKMIHQNPKEISYVMLKGNVYDFLSLPDSALNYYLLAEKMEPESGRAKQQLAKFYQSRGDSVNYDLKTYESLMSEDLDLSEKLAQMADYLQRIITEKGDTLRGDNLFKTLRDQYPHEPEILFLSARYNAAKGNYRQAIEDVNYAIDLDGTNTNLWEALMVYLVSAEDYGKAITTYDRLLKEGINPTLSIDLTYASAAMQSDSLPTALNIYDKYIKQAEHTLSVTDSVSDKSKYRHLGSQEVQVLSNFYEMAGDAYYSHKPPMLEDAYRCYENALFFDPDNALALNNYAYFIIEQDNPAPESERFQRAKAMSRKALDKDSDNGTYLDTYAWILFKEGNYKEAKEYQEAAVEGEEKNGTVTSELYSHLGDILFMCGDAQGALINWEKALKLSPDDKLLKKKVNGKTFFWE
ncbi:MAG: tetratricopeptide repeat protein [Muribaculum sp.]|nr:tetratricopeptide repeat protein [Muribaculum sp.]